MAQRAAVSPVATRLHPHPCVILSPRRLPAPASVTPNRPSGLSWRFHRGRRIGHTQEATPLIPRGNWTKPTVLHHQTSQAPAARGGGSVRSTAEPQGNPQAHAASCLDRQDRLSPPEEWRPVVGYEGLYEVSDQGRVRWVRNGGTRLLRNVGTAHAKRRETVQLHRNNKGKTRFVHHLVLEAFVGARPSNCECNHINGKPSDNRATNLEWITPRANFDHATRLGLMRQWEPGEANPNAKLNESQVRIIRRLHHRLDVAEIAAIFGVSRPLVSHIQSRSRWRHIP